MSLSREQMREQMIDYLYGELQGEDLARFEAALAESAQSRRELAELQDTLHAARAELARDTHAQPPAGVRDAVLKAAHAQLAAARPVASRSDHAAAAQGPRSPAARVLRWLRSAWVLPSLVAAAAAALLVFKNEQHTVHPDTPTASSAREVSPAPPPSSAAEPATASEATTAEPRAAAEDSSSEIAAPRVEAPARPARKRTSPRGTKFAAPPADWQRKPSADTQARAPSATRAAPTLDDRAPAGAAPEPSKQRAIGALKASEASAEGSTLGGAAPAAADSPTSSTLSAERSSDALQPAPPKPLTATVLERRAREHAAATRWVQAAADYRELLRRFPEDPRRKLWREQLELALRAAAQPAPSD